MANARRGNGFALLAAIFILVILSTMAAVMAQLYVGQSKGALEALDSAKAFALADGGMRWIFQNQFDGDTDFTNNASPTGAPFGGTPVTMGEGQFWVEYANATSSDIDLKVTAKVGNAVRVVQAHLARTAGGGSGSPGTGPIFSATDVIYAAEIPPGSPPYDDGSVDARALKGTITGDVRAEGPYYGSKKVTVTGTVSQNLATHPYAGVDFQWFFDRKTSYTVAPVDGLDLIFGSYGTPNGIWYIDGDVYVYNSGSGDAVLTGTTVITGNLWILMSNSPGRLVAWPSQRNIDGDAALEWLPSLVVGGGCAVTSWPISKIETHGLACFGGKVIPGRGGISLSANDNSLQTIVKGMWLSWGSVESDFSMFNSPPAAH
ncbi:MAG: hypothetical protein HYZ93_04965 [Candidatus Omnitrophica bacterium]|nr:hypothetical protein [Candidatus Omnitrophota bacterium]